MHASHPTATPYDTLPPVSALTVSSSSVVHGGPLNAPQLSARFGAPNGQDQSPQLSWSGAPAETRSFIVSMFDVDAPTPSGLWHWMVADIPANTTSLTAGAAGLPARALQIANDTGTPDYLGAAPPAGGGPHRYAIAVQALDVASITDLRLSSSSTPAYISALTLSHVVARGVLVSLVEL